MKTIQFATLSAAIVFTVFGAVLALAGVWIPEFWNSDTCLKLFATNVVLAVASSIVASIAKVLS